LRSNGVWAPIDEQEPAEWERTINTNLRGAFLTPHFAVPHLTRALADRWSSHPRSTARGLVAARARQPTHARKLPGRDDADGISGTRSLQDPGECGLPDPTVDPDRGTSGTPGAIRAKEEHEFRHVVGRPAISPVSGVLHAG